MKRFKPNDKAIFRPKAEHVPLKEIDPYDGRKVKVFGEGVDGWDYTIFIKDAHSSQKKYLCMDDELEEI